MARPKKNAHVAAKTVKKVPVTKFEEAEVPPPKATVPDRPLVQEVAKEVESVKAEVERTAPVGRKESEEERMNRTVLATVKAVVGELVPAMMAMQNASSAGQRPARENRRWIQCRVCKQAGPNKAPCNGEHIKMVVYPSKYPEFGKWFQGAIINGIRYLSDGRRDRIDIPAACEGQITKQVADYEENERVTVMGRSASHDSGSISEGGGGNANGATSAWR